MTRSGRVFKQPDRYGEYVAHETYQPPSTFEPHTEYVNPIVMMSSSDPDTMYYHVLEISCILPYMYIFSLYLLCKSNTLLFNAFYLRPA
jgi:hypothetical protein